MDFVLLDTDVFSFFFKRDSRAEFYRPFVAEARLCLAFQSVAELRCWVLLRNWGDSRREELEASIRRCVVLPFDDASANIWAQVTANRQAAGQPIACGDAWIAAAALRHGLPLLTHNGSDFRGVAGLSVISQRS